MVVDIVEKNKAWDGQQSKKASLRWYLENDLEKVRELWGDLGEGHPRQKEQPGHRPRGRYLPDAMEAMEALGEQWRGWKRQHEEESRRK